VPTLRRDLGLFSATMIAVGGTIGGGIFFAPAEAARALPAGPFILGVWIVGILVALAGALTFAELAAMFPRAGGPYVFLREAFGPLAAFLYGWMLLVSISTGALAAVSVAFAGYLGEWIDLTPLGGPIGVAVATIALLTAINYLGLRPGAAVQNLLTVAKITGLALLIGGGLLAWQRLGAPAPIAAAPSPRTSLSAGIATAFVAVLFTVGGWQQMTMVAGEVRDPARRIPLALGLAAAIIGVVYVLVNAVYLGVLGRDGMAASTAVAAETARRIAPLGGEAVTIAAGVSILGIANVILLATPRVLFAMGEDGLFPRAVSGLHRRFAAPSTAVLVIGAWAIVLLVFAGGEVGRLLGAVVFADWIFFGLGAASVFVLRRRYGDEHRPYRVWGYPAVPAFFVVAAIGAVGSAVIASPLMSLMGAALLGAGAVAYAARWMIPASAKARR
jgi:APA family basic amino acid/polyamine antiporter